MVWAKCTNTPVVVYEFLLLHTVSQLYRLVRSLLFCVLSRYQGSYLQLCCVQPFLLRISYEYKTAAAARARPTTQEISSRRNRILLVHVSRYSNGQFFSGCRIERVQISITGFRSNSVRYLIDVELSLRECFSVFFD